MNEDGEIIGMTAWIDADRANGTVEIGNSYITAGRRGTGVNTPVNTIVKRMMLDHAFAHGCRRVAFKIDELNARSQAAIRKLGAVKEGVLRADRVTWTGRIRDTGVYANLAADWAARHAAPAAAT